MHVDTHSAARLGRIGRLVALSMIALLAACGGGGGSASSQTPKVSTGATRTVVDLAGRHVQIPANVTRVATSISAIPSLIALLGASSKLVYRPTPTYTPLLQSAVPAFNSVPSSASISDFSFEDILKARPQVFIAASTTESLFPQLTRVGIPYFEITGVNTPAQVDAENNMIADVLGGSAPARAKEFNDYTDGIIRQVQTKTASSSRPSVYLAVRSPTTTVGQGNNITNAIEEAGGQNVAAAHGIGATGGLSLPTITVETLLAWNPQYILTDLKTQQQFMSDPRYATLAAVRDHHVDTYLDDVGTQSVLLPLFIAKVIHPDLFASVDLATEVKNFYSKFYNYQPTAQQLQGILNGTLTD